MNRTKIAGLRAALPLALITMIAGCDNNPSGPGSGLNALAALADYGAMDGVLASSGFKNFRMTAARMDGAMLGPAAVGAARASSALDLAANGEGAAFAAAMAGVASEMADAPAGVPLISTGNRGKTFVYDAQRHQWVHDPARTGAPANGVRFITYEPRGAEPDPTKPTGHADLIDLGDTGAGIALRLLVVEGSRTVLDYQTTLEGSAGVGHVTVAGFLQNASDKLDFEIDVRGQNSGGVERADVTFELSMASRAFEVDGDVEVEKRSGRQKNTVDLSVRHGTSSFRVDVADDAGALSGTIDLDDKPFAVVSGTSAQPVFKTPSGGDISGMEGLVLWRIFDITEDVFDLFEDLVDPIDELVVLAFVL
jgi:hypothetical protein